MRCQQPQIDRARQGELERPDFAALEAGSERLRPERALVALLEQRIHALAKLGQPRLRSLAREQVAPNSPSSCLIARASEG